MESMGSSLSCLSKRGSTSATNGSSPSLQRGHRGKPSRRSKVTKREKQPTRASYASIPSESSSIHSIQGMEDNDPPSKKLPRPSGPTTLRNRRGKASMEFDDTSETNDASTTNKTKRMGRTKQGRFKTTHQAPRVSKQGQEAVVIPLTSDERGAKTGSIRNSTEASRTITSSDVLKDSTQPDTFLRVLQEVDSQSRLRSEPKPSWKQPSNDALDDAFLDCDEDFSVEDIGIPDSVQFKESCRFFPPEQGTVNDDFDQKKRPPSPVLLNHEPDASTIEDSSSMAVPTSSYEFSDTSFASCEEGYSSEESGEERSGFCCVKMREGHSHEQDDDRDDQEGDSFNHSGTQRTEEDRQEAEPTFDKFQYENFPMVHQHNWVRPSFSHSHTYGRSSNYPVENYPMEPPPPPGVHRPIPRRVIPNQSLGASPAQYGYPDVAANWQGHQRYFRTTHESFSHASYNPDYHRRAGGFYNPYETNHLYEQPQPRASAYPTEAQRASTSARYERPLQERPTGTSSSSRVPPSGRTYKVSGQPVPQSRPSVVHRPQRQLPPVFTVRGIKVTMVDYKKKIFIIDLVPPKHCELIKYYLNDHLHRVEAKGEETWSTLYTYTKMDLPARGVKSIAPYIELLMRNISDIVGVVYGNPTEAAKLMPRSWKEPHFLLYQCVPGKPNHTGVEMHFDGCHITWNLMLSGMNEYQGGGTYVRCLKRTVKLHQGQVLVHPGDLYHKGVDITRGTRLLMVGFMDGFKPGIEDNSRQTEKEVREYEKMVISF